MDPLIRFATKLVALLAVIPGAYRPPEEQTWGSRLKSLLTFDSAWLLATFLAAWFLNRRKIKSALAEKLPKATDNRAIGGLFSPDQNALMEKACQITLDAKEEWQAVAAGAAMAAAVNAIGLDSLENIIEQLRSGRLANPPPAPEAGMQARYNALLSGGPLPTTQERSVRFDRADFEVRDKILAQSAEMKSGVDPRKEAPQSASDNSIVAAHLRSIGHSESEVARLLAGPPDRETAIAQAHLRALGYSAADAERLLKGPKA